MALCEGNSPVTGEFPSQRPVARGFDVFFDLRLNKSCANNQEAGDLTRHRPHYDEIVMKSYAVNPIWDDNIVDSWDGECL